MLSCFKLTINHIGLFREGFLKKVEFELQRKGWDFSRKSKPYPFKTLVVKQVGHWSFLLTHLWVAVPFVPREEGSPQSQYWGPQRAPNLLPHGHISCFGIHITFLKAPQRQWSVFVLFLFSLLLTLQNPFQPDLHWQTPWKIKNYQIN